jgi:hypothetical protein
MIRVTPLNLDGSIDASRPILTTNGFISASFGTEFEDGDEITEKAADGSVCIQYKADDSMKGITFNLTLCTPDPEAAALLAGGKIICAAADILDDESNVVVTAGEVIGYSSPVVGATVGNPVAIEIWSKAIVKGKPASGTPYWHWAFPYVRVRYEGDREFTNGALANEYSGTGVGNEALTTAGLNPVTATDDFVKYKEALANPFSYVRSTAKPDISAGHWSGGTGGGGQWDKTAENSIGCVAALSTGATAGTPGSFTPGGSTTPASVAALQAAAPPVVASPTTPYTATNKALTSNVVTLTIGTHAIIVGNLITVALSPADPVFDGRYVVTAIAASTVSYAKTNANVTGTATGGSVTRHPPWTTGQYVQTQTAGTGGQAYWNGAAWVAGAAP